MSLVNKKQVLTKMGFSPKTLSLMTESEISKLFKTFLIETKKEPKESIMVKDAKKALEIQKLDPNAKIEVTEKKQTNKKNPFAICTSVMGAEFGTKERSEWSKKQMGKYEKCVVGVKKSIKEGKNPLEVLLEDKFRSIIVENLKPQITKADIMKMIFEDMKMADPAVKPKTKPDTDTDFDPFKEPDTNDQPEAISPEPTTKPNPGTKPAPTTNPNFDPFKEPDTNDQPEAGLRGLQSFMSEVKRMGMLKE